MMLIWPTVNLSERLSQTPRRRCQVENDNVLREQIFTAGHDFNSSRALDVTGRFLQKRRPQSQDAVKNLLSTYCTYGTDRALQRHSAPSTRSRRQTAHSAGDMSSITGPMT
ncbi:hypothetical protein EYF80_054718 [Liparis tanakae]|uniref:Uncharacterized protein n=1 Tax=Liparis tanakae TaxID=230148 RepID=A0A4Z2F2G0_9TELE|nr:hypothetical protein EYF80_054718 [Liparis tanakae]